jgi:hypothetical protein
LWWCFIGGVVLLVSVHIDKKKLFTVIYCDPLKTQKELSLQANISQAGTQGRNHAHELNKMASTPPTEPAGRAQPGHSYEQ